ncbi:MAG: hypothetical protein V5A44_00880 [Haloarculaceae archaeon]
MDLNELQSVQSRERQTDSLQQLRATFYQEAAEYIQDLEAERDAAAERADDPWNAPEVGRLNDDIDTAKGTVEAIYDRRVGKIVKMASLAAAEMPTDDEGLTEEEQALFDQLVTAIERNREGVFAILDGEDPPIDPTDLQPPAAADPPAPEGSGPTGASPSGAGSAASSVDTATPAASGETDHRQVPPDPGDPGSGADADPAADPSASPVPEPDVGAADLMGGETGTGSSDGVSGDADSGDAGPTAEGDSTDPPMDGESTDAVDAGRPVRDGGTTGTATTDPSARTVEARDGRGGATDGQSRTERTRDGESDADAGADADPDVDRTMVRITDDVGPIYGVEGREYDLAADDVVTLPEANVGPLLEQGAAERLD